MNKIVYNKNLFNKFVELIENEEYFKSTIHSIASNQIIFRSQYKYLDEIIAFGSLDENVFLNYDIQEAFHKLINSVREFEKFLSGHFHPVTSHRDDEEMYSWIDKKQGESLLMSDYRERAEEMAKNLGEHEDRINDEYREFRMIVTENLYV